MKAGLEFTSWSYWHGRKYVILVCKKDQKVLFYGCEKVNKKFWFCNLFPFKRQCICYSCSYEKSKFKPRYVKRVPEAGHFSIEGYTKRGAFLWQKFCKKRVRGWTSSYKTLLRTPPGSTSIIEALVISVLIFCNFDLFCIFILFYFQWKGHQSLSGVNPINLVFYISFYLRNATPNWRFLYSAQFILPNSSLTALRLCAFFYEKKYLFILITSTIINKNLIARRTFT